MLLEPSYQKRKKSFLGSPISESCSENALWRKLTQLCHFASRPLSPFSCLEWVWHLEPQWARYDHTATLKMEVTYHGRAEEQEEPGAWRAWSTRLQDLCYMRAEEARYLGFLLPVTQHCLHRYVAWWPCSLWAPVTHTFTTVFRGIFGYKQSSLPI